MNPRRRRCEIENVWYVERVADMLRKSGNKRKELLRDCFSDGVLIEMPNDITLLPVQHRLRNHTDSS